MAFSSRIRDRVRSLLFRHLLHRFGFGSPVSKSVWEKQFETGVWDYLEGPAEAQHYEVIAAMYAGKKSNSVLDIGCGKGVLYRYLTERGVPEKYLGVDISHNAVDAAAAKFPGAKFLQADMNKNSVNGKFDLIIFNESLYYFHRPQAVLKKCCAENLGPNGSVIVSMCVYPGHEAIWEGIDHSFDVLEEAEAVNDSGQRWKIKQLQPK